MKAPLLLCLTALCLPLALPAHTGPASASPGLASPSWAPRESPERLEAWPELDSATEKTAAREISKLRAARTPEMESAARTALEQVGAGAAPLLLKALGKEKKADARKRLSGVLDQLTGAAHTRPLSTHFDARSGYVRYYALARCAQFPDEQIAAAAMAALAVARKQSADEKAKPEAKQLARKELEAAALCVASAGSLESFELLFGMAQSDWKRHAAALGPALAGVRGAEAGRLAIGLAKEPTDLTALRLLSLCGDREAVSYIAPGLDSEDNNRRVAAVNALRRIIDDQPPIEKLSVFDAIERAKAWKVRL